MELFQPSLGFIEEKKSQPKSTALSAFPKKTSFTPPTMENGLSKGMCVDHAMLFVRTMTKQSRGNPQKYLFQQLAEIKFKRTEYDQVQVVREALVSSIKG